RSTQSSQSPLRYFITTCEARNRLRTVRCRNRGHEDTKDTKHTKNRRGGTRSTRWACLRQAHTGSTANAERTMSTTNQIRSFDIGRARRAALRRRVECLCELCELCGFGAHSSLTVSRLSRPTAAGKQEQPPFVPHRGRRIAARLYRES